MVSEATTETVTHRGLCPEEDAFVSILRTGDALMRATEFVLKDSGVSPTQYNVMRILRGSPDGLPCSEVAKRMISRDPDITRLLDRMEKRGLITRQRATTDRRLVVTKITREGLAALAALDEPVRRAHRETLGHLGAARLQSLVELLDVARERVG
ncbi:MAG TPA: MarR family transcriptional regulator [Candidatus Acidoferrum sp.]|nr:MarR family transcriptional regulator [Candidatus Acidoferrum sp.]